MGKRDESPERLASLDVETLRHMTTGDPTPAHVEAVIRRRIRAERRRAVRKVWDYRLTIGARATKAITEAILVRPTRGPS